MQSESGFGVSENGDALLMALVNGFFDGGNDGKRSTCAKILWRFW